MFKLQHFNSFNSWLFCEKTKAIFFQSWHFVKPKTASRNFVSFFHKTRSRTKVLKSIQANNECCGINGADDWVNSDFGKVPEECCLSGNQYSRIEIANTRKQVNRTYCKSEEDGGVNFIGCEIQAKGIVEK